MTKAKKILFVTQEMLPFVPETDMAQMGRYLPQAVQEKSREIRSFMPKWGIINERRNQLHEVIRLSGINIVVDDTDHPLVIKVASIPAARMQIYFIDNDDFFEKRKMATDEDGKEYEDNAERAAFYARGVLETIKKLKWTPDIIHCQGWMGSFIPLYVKTAYAEEPSYRDCKVIYTPSTQMLAANIPANMDGIIAFRNATISATRGLGEKKLVPMLNKLGVKYADGIGFVAENEELMKYAESLGKPSLPPVGTDDYGIYYPNFYDTIWNIGKEEEEEEES
ncbi:MAG: glycogen/starch synthase [Bacteroidaceae bacterium]|nr:glycogen/starch synthase [Bacteroidaceae bacterium]